MRRPTIATTVVLLAAGLLAGCGADGGMTTLAKVDGWREGRAGADLTFGHLEIAYDQATAERLWAENVPADLPERSGDPTEPGVYGDLAEVDYDAEVVAVWSSVQSGSCPGWLTAVHFSGGTLGADEATDAAPTEACTADANPYRVVVVLPREDVPAPTDLPVRGGDRAPDAVVYP